MRLRWRGVPGTKGGRAPGGVQACDLAAEALVLVIEGRRAWDPVSHPDFEQYLRSIIDSRVSALVTSAENRRTRRVESAVPVADGPEAPDDPPEAQFPDPMSPEPGDVVATRELRDQARALMEAELGNDPSALSILECLEADITKPAEIAELAGVSVEEIYNAQRRFRRAAEKVNRNLGQRKTP